MNIDNYKLNRNGQSMVELALVMPIFILLMVGFFEWGMYLFARMTLDSAAYSAARKAVTYQDWPVNTASRQQEVIEAFMNKADFIPETLVDNIENNINIEFDADIDNIEFVEVNTSQLEYGSISGFHGLYGLPDNIKTKARVRYEGY